MSFWDLFKLKEGGQETKTLKQPEKLTPYEQHQRDRKQWEADARYILECQGKNPDLVESMGDEMLIHIIRTYLDI